MSIYRITKTKSRFGKSKFDVLMMKNILYNSKNKEIFFNFLKSLEYSSKTVHFKLVREKITCSVKSKIITSCSRENLRRTFSIERNEYVLNPD